MIGRRVVVVGDYFPPEWATKFWGKGGYLDQVYLRVARGEDPLAMRQKRFFSRVMRVYWVVILTLAFLIFLLRSVAQIYW